MCFFTKGVARGGGSCGARDPPPPVFYSNNLQYSGCENASTLCLTQCDPPPPPLKNPGYAHVYGGLVIVQVFSYTIVDKACSAPDVVLLAIVTLDLVNSVA